MLAKALHARALELAKLGGLAVDRFELIQEPRFLRVGRVTQLIDSTVDATGFGFFVGRSAERTPAQQQKKRE